MPSFFRKHPWTSLILICIGGLVLGGIIGTMLGVIATVIIYMFASPPSLLVWGTNIDVHKLLQVLVPTCWVIGMVLGCCWSTATYYKMKTLEK